MVIEDFESFKAMLSTTPIHVDTEWMNMLLAQFWQLYATWSEEFVRSQLEFYTNGLGLKTENSTLGKVLCRVHSGFCSASRVCLLSQTLPTHALR